MKLFFTQKTSSFRIAVLAFITLLITLPGIAQTTHQVEVTNNVYTPKNITINLGDKIVWTCTQGNHNVNATQSTFPSNPESFGNSVAAGWTFEHTFNTVGSYNYHCDPHVSFGMVGTVEVADVSTATNFSFNSNKLKVFPNPTDAYLNISIGEMNNSYNSIKIYNTAGILVMRSSFDDESLKVIDMRRLDSGFYIIELDGDTKSERLKVLKQ